VTLSFPVYKNGRFLRRMERLGQGRAGFSTRWRETVTTGAPGGDPEAGVLSPAALGVAVTIAEVLRGIFQGVLLGADQGHPVVLHGLCRGVPLYHLGPAPVHQILCRRTINIIKMLWSAIVLMLLGFERL